MGKSKKERKTRYRKHYSNSKVTKLLFKIVKKEKDKDLEEILWRITTNPSKRKRDGTF